jgi:hypothetical protein
MAGVPDVLHQTFLVSPPLKRPKRSPAKALKRYHMKFLEMIRVFYSKYPRSTKMLCMFDIYKVLLPH